MHLNKYINILSIYSMRWQVGKLSNERENEKFVIYQCNMTMRVLTFVDIKTWHDNENFNTCWHKNKIWQWIKKRTIFADIHKKEDEVNCKICRYKNKTWEFLYLCTLTHNITMWILIIVDTVLPYNGNFDICGHMLRVTTNILWLFWSQYEVDELSYHTNNEYSQYIYIYKCIQIRYTIYLNLIHQEHLYVQNDHTSVDSVASSIFFNQKGFTFFLDKCKYLHKFSWHVILTDRNVMVVYQYISFHIKGSPVICPFS